MGHVQNFINSYPDNWLERLVEIYKIDVVYDLVNGKDEGTGLVSLKYNQIESPMHEPIVQECRGMVVDLDTKKVIAHPYNKFWNHGEKLAQPIDWSTAHVLEKLDGSLMILYHWEPIAGLSGWVVASSGHPSAGGSFGSNKTDTFRYAFQRMFSASGMLVPRGYEGYTFMFELCAAENRVVVRHEKPRLVLHGARRPDGSEVPHFDLEVLGAQFKWEVVESHPITSIEEALAHAAKVDPLASEGLVVVDANFHRVKIKSPRYVLLHHMKGEATPRRAIELWQTGETSELLASFPEMGATITPIQEKLDHLAYMAALHYRDRCQLATKKEFAVQVKDHACAPVLFKLWDRWSGVASGALQIPKTASDDFLRDSKSIMREHMTLAALEKMLERSGVNLSTGDQTPA